MRKQRTEKIFFVPPQVLNNSCGYEIEPIKLIRRKSNKTKPTQTKKFIKSITGFLGELWE